MFYKKKILFFILIFECSVFAPGENYSSSQPYAINSIDSLRFTTSSNNFNSGMSFQPNGFSNSLFGMQTNMNFGLGGFNPQSPWGSFGFLTNPGSFAMFSRSPFILPQGSFAGMPMFQQSPNLGNFGGAMSSQGLIGAFGFPMQASAGGFSGLGTSTQMGANVGGFNANVFNQSLSSSFGLPMQVASNGQMLGSMGGGQFQNSQPLQMGSFAPQYQNGNLGFGSTGFNVGAAVITDLQSVNFLDVDLQIKLENKQKIEFEIESGDMTKPPKKTKITIETAPTTNIKSFIRNIDALINDLNKTSFSDFLKKEPIETLKSLASELMWLRFNFLNFDKVKADIVSKWLLDSGNDISKKIMQIIEKVLDNFETVSETLFSHEEMGRSSDISQDRETKSALFALIASIFLDINVLYFKLDEINVDWKSRELSDLEKKIVNKQITGRCQMLYLLAEFPNFSLFTENNLPTPAIKTPIFQLSKTKDFLNKLQIIRQILIGNVGGKYSQLGDMFTSLISDYKDIATAIGGGMISAINQAVANASFATTGNFSSPRTGGLTVKHGDIIVPKNETIFFQAEVFEALVWGLSKYFSMFSEINLYERNNSSSAFNNNDIVLLKLMVSFCLSQEIFIPLIYNKSAASNFNLRPNLILEELLIKIIVKTCETLGDAIEKKVNEGASVGFEQLKKLLINLNDKFLFWPKNSTNDAQVALKNLIMKNLLGSVKTKSGLVLSVFEDIQKDSFGAKEAKEDIQSLTALKEILDNLLEKSWKEIVFLPEEIRTLETARKEAQEKIDNPA